MLLPLNCDSQLLKVGQNASGTFSPPSSSAKWDRPSLSQVSSDVPARASTCWLKLIMCWNSWMKTPGSVSVAKSLSTVQPGVTVPGTRP